MKTLSILGRGVYSLLYYTFSPDTARTEFLHLKCCNSINYISNPTCASALYIPRSYYDPHTKITLYIFLYRFEKNILVYNKSTFSDNQFKRET